MPVVLNYPQAQRYPDTRAQAWGQAVNEGVGSVTDVLLKVLLAGGGQTLGQKPMAPTPQHPGTFNFPLGSQSPIEAAMIRQLGGVPAGGGGATQFLSQATQQLNPSSPGNVSYNAPTRLGIVPTMQRQLDEAKLAEAQQSIALNKQLGGYYEAAGASLKPPTTRPTGQPPPSPAPLPFSGTSPVVKGLFQKAGRGDPQALHQLTLLAMEKNDDEAIQALVALGVIDAAQ